ncbi:MAG TPA: hypothetical protein VH415_06430 [Nitrososphaeraceae archaeon]|jgi:hypothetical protein
MQNKRGTTWLRMVSVLIAAVISTSILSTNAVMNTYGQETTVVRDSQTIFLGGEAIPANDFIHLYDTTPFMIMSGHIATKLPCGDDSESPYKILIGQAPNLRPAELELVTELSTPGERCLYHVDLESQPGVENGTITDIAIQNPTNEDIEFGPTDTVVIGVNEIAPLAGEEGNATESMAMGNSTS